VSLLPGSSTPQIGCQARRARAARAYTHLVDSLSVIQGILPLIRTLQAIGEPLQLAIVLVACLTAVVAAVPRLAPWRRLTLGAMTVLLLAGEAVLAWFHFRLYQLTPVIEPATGRVTGHMAVSLWVEGERLYVWALTVAVLGMLMRKEREHLLPGVMLSTAVLAIADMFTGNPFTDPVPTFLSQYAGYVQAMYQGGTAADMAWQGMEAARQFFYGSWFMWVHPPLLYFSYGAFTLSFVATVQMIRQRHSSFETIAYDWARLGYLPLTAGMLLGFPWAIEAWTGESWWWSGFVNMSIMMWLLYTAYLHARLYLRRRHMWQAVAALAVLSFVVLILTYVATYVVPGAHSYAALAPSAQDAASTALALCRGGGA
jgi:cytochrome c biogenesis factor